MTYAVCAFSFISALVAKWTFGLPIARWFPHADKLIVRIPQHMRIYNDVYMWRYRTHIMIRVSTLSKINYCLTKIKKEKKNINYKLVHFKGFFLSAKCVLMILFKERFIAKRSREREKEREYNLVYSDIFGILSLQSI